MNTLALSLFHSTLRSFPHHSKLLVTFSSQASVQNATFRKRKPISRAMRAYIDRVKEFERRHIVESAEYESGKRFLAKIMCEDQESFTDKDVKTAIQYLLPSGVFVDWTRPVMEPPQDSVQAPKFDDTGRPYHYLFYTAAPKMFELQHEIVSRLNKADKLLEQVHRKGHKPEREDKIDILGSDWIKKEHLTKMIDENMSDSDFENVIAVLERLSEHPMSSHFKDFIMTYRTPVVVELSKMTFPEVQSSEDGRSFAKASARRKHCDADVIVRSPGKGNIVINGTHDILYFDDLQARHQILFPLEVCELLGKVDLEVDVRGPGESSQAGAVRLATSLALAALVDEETRIKLRIAGLFQPDVRHRERKKPGKKGARRGYTWLKR